MTVGLTGPASSQELLTEITSDTFGQFGTEVAGAGDVNGDGFDDVIVSAPLFGAELSGAAFVFLGGASGLQTMTTATAHAQLEGWNADVAEIISAAGVGDVNGDGFDDVMLGAPTRAGVGAALVFLGSASGVSGTNAASAAALLTEGTFDIDFGRHLTGAGDVNGDGYDDVIVGAPDWDNGQLGEGAAFVYHGSAAGLVTTAATRLESNQDFVRFGERVGAAGDVNGDGYDDVIVGAPEYFSGQADEGAAFVFLGSASGIVGTNPATAHAQLDGDLADGLFGFSAAGAGDVNGDGYDDVIVGAEAYGAASAENGAAFVFHGSPVGIPSASASGAPTRILGDQLGSDFGVEVDGAGDVNGDGYDDVVVLSPTYSDGQVNEGAAFVFFGGPSGITATSPGDAGAHIQHDQAMPGPFLTVGMTSVAGTGDVYGDGTADVLAGSATFDVASGRAFLVGTPAPAVPGPGVISLAALGGVLAAGALACLRAPSGRSRG